MIELIDVIQWTLVGSFVFWVIVVSLWNGRIEKRLNKLEAETEK